MNVNNIFTAITMSDEDGISLFGPALQLVAASMEDAKNPKLRRMVSAASMAVTVGSLGNKFYRNLRSIERSSKVTYNIRVDEGDLYYELRRLMYVDADPSEYPTMSLDLKWSSESRTKRSPQIQQTFDATGSTSTIKLAGHEMLVVIDSGKGGGTRQGELELDSLLGTSNNVASRPYLEILCDTHEIRQDVVDFLSNHMLELVTPPPRFYVSAKWGGFSRVSDIPIRPKESVILKDGQMDRIMNYLEGFLEQEEQYVDLGIPYRTGVLLSGRPGSGKSSTASAIAFELGLDIYFITLSSVSSDEDLISLMEAVPPRSIVILEDIDIAKATKARTDEGHGGVTMSGLLNSLDGMVSPHGVITLMTTNYRDSMDDAITRPGRVDLEEEITDIDDYQLREICQHFLGYVPEGLPTVTQDMQISSASLVGVFKKYIPNIQDSSEELLDFLQEKVVSFTK